MTGINFAGSAQGVSGTITVNGSGQSGVTVTVTGGGGTYTGRTTSNGAYTIGGVPNGTYTVTPSLSGYTFTPASQSVNVSGAYVTGVNFTGTPPGNTYTISGTFTITGMTILSGIPVTLSGSATGSTTTNTSGFYIFSGLGNGSYTVTAGQPTGIVIVYNTSSKSATIDNNNATLNFSGSVCTKCTSGTVALTDGTPVAGVSVSAANASATTDDTGLYILQPPGNGQGSQQGVEGTIVPSLPGYAFTPGNRPCDSHHLTHQNFTAVPQGQGAVKEGSGMTGGSGQPGAARRPQARHPEASFEASPLKDLGQGPSSAGRGQTASSSYGVRPHGGPGPSPFGRGEACDGMDEGEAAGMEAEAAPTAAVRTEAATLTNTATYFYVWDQVGSVRLERSEG